MKSWKTHSTYRSIIAGMLWVFALSASAQKITHFEGYFNYIDHRCMVMNSDKTCDSLNLKDYQGKKPDMEMLVCYEQDYTGQDVMIYDRNGVAIFMDTLGNLYSKDNYKAESKPYYLNIHIKDLLKGRRDMVIEADDSDYDSLVLRAIPLKDYRLGRVNKKGSTQIAIYYDNFTYPAKGELSPTVMNKMYDGIKMIPEDGKVEDKLTIIIPINEVNVPGSFSLYIYDLRGNILRMYTNLNKVENIIYRENFMSGTYRYVIYFDNGKVEIKKGMLNFKEPPKPE